MQYIWATPNLEQATELAALGFRQKNGPELREDVRQHVQTADTCLCMHENGRLVGYMLFQLAVDDLLYIAGTILHPEYQGRGYKAEATQVAMNHYTERTYFAGRTQSPIVWSSVTRLASAVYPHPSASTPAAAMLDALDRLVVFLGMKAVVEQGFYGGPLYGHKPIHRNEKVQTWWDTLIDFNRGDALLYIAQR